MIRKVATRKALANHNNIEERRFGLGYKLNGHERGSFWRGRRKRE